MSSRTYAEAAGEYFRHHEEGDDAPDLLAKDPYCDPITGTPYEAERHTAEEFARMQAIEGICECGHPREAHRLLSAFLRPTMCEDCGCELFEQVAAKPTNTARLLLMVRVMGGDSPDADFAATAERAVRETVRYMRHVTGGLRATVESVVEIEG
jgi:hypothetical protein